MKVITYIMVLLLASMTSCDNTVINKKKISEYNSLLDEYSSIFNDSLINHFPDSIDSLYSFFHYRSKSQEDFLLKRNSLILCALVSSQELDSIKYLASNSIETIYPNDGCALIVSIFDNKSPDLKADFEREIAIQKNENIEQEISLLEKELKIKRDNTCEELTLPIPNFSPVKFFDYNIVNGNRLTDDFTLFILNAGKGYFLPEEYLTHGIGLPLEWKNGFSKGIAINENENIVIFWIEVW